MKRLFCALLMVCLILSLLGCQKTEKSVATTEETVAHTESVWTPYNGDMENYVYYYEKGLNHLWEEDLLFVADTYLEKHALLTPEESRVSYRDGVVWDGYYTDEMYDPEIRTAFLEQINEIIPRIEEMDKTQFLFSVQKLLAVLGDAHAYLTCDFGESFPCSVIPYNDAFYAVSLHKEHEELLFSQLISINGMALSDVIEALRPYVPYENEYWFIHYLTKPYYIEALFSLDLLQMAGVLGDTDTAQFQFKKDDGTLHTIELTAVLYYEESFADYVDAYYFDSPMYQNSSKKFWHTFLGDTPYLRISSFDFDEEDADGASLLDVGNALLAEVRDAGGAEKLIVDLRNNGGGYQLLGYHQVISVLNRMDVGTIYVLIDGGTFSQTVIFATYICQEVDNAILVGTPAGQAPNFFGAVEEHTMPNTETTFVLAWQWWKGWEDYEYDALMPDILVEQTLQDYKDGRDAVLDYLLNEPIERKPR